MATVRPTLPSNTVKELFHRAIVAGVDHAAGITGGDMMTCALIADGTVSCWGYQLPKPTQVPGVVGAVALSHGIDDHACALLAGGKVACWAPGPGSASSVSGISDAVALAVSQGHSSALLRDGRVLCWGDCGSAVVAEPTLVPNMTGAVELGLGRHPKPAKHDHLKTGQRS